MAVSERVAGLAIAFAGIAAVVGQTLGQPEFWDSVTDPDKNVRAREAQLQAFKTDPETQKGVREGAFTTCVTDFTKWWHGTDSNQERSEVVNQITKPGPNTIAKVIKFADENRPVRIDQEARLVRYDFDDCAAKGVQRHEQELERQLKFARESKTSGAVATLAMGVGLPLFLIGGGLWMARPRRREDDTMPPSRPSATALPIGPEQP